MHATDEVGVFVRYGAVSNQHGSKQEWGEGSNFPLSRYPKLKQPELRLLTVQAEEWFLRGVSEMNRQLLVQKGP